jgi:integrase
VKITKALLSEQAALAEARGKAILLREGTGFQVRVVSPSKSPVAAVRYRLGAAGRKAPIKEAKIGEITLSFSLDAARRRADEIKSAARQGRDLIQEERDAREAEIKDKQMAVDLLFEVVGEKWIAWLEKKEKRHRDTPRIVRKDLIPAWKGKRVDHITKSDIREIARTVTERAKSSGRANATGRQGDAVLKVARRFFKWAISEDYVKANPTMDLQADVRDGKRTRRLSPREIRAYWKSTGQLGYPFGPCLRLMLLTAQRENMVARADLNEVDYDDQLWEIPPERTKKVVQEKPHILPLTNRMIEIFQQAEKLSASETLFFSTTGETAISGWSNAKETLDELMLIEMKLEAKAMGEDPDDVALTPWILHDLRRTAGTAMVEQCGVELKIADLVLHHLPRNMTEIQVRYLLGLHEKEMLEALELWDAWLVEILANPRPEKRKGRNRQAAPLSAS